MISSSEEPKHLLSAWVESLGVNADKYTLALENIAKKTG